MTTAFADLSQVEIEALTPEEYSYYLANGALDTYTQSEYEHISAHLRQYDI
jgi:hypothetical protein